MITAAYTICKNEIKYVEKWLYYTKDFDYRVILDTGSTDGTYEEFKKAGNVIVEQKIFDPWHFSNARNYNLDMIPDHVEWCLSPDLDEYFSINVLTQMEKMIKENPKVTNIACDRLDIYSDVVRVGPPHQQATNKIHLRHDYYWTQPIYEHLWWKHDRMVKPEVEIYNEHIYLIHDQDFKKKERPELYTRMLKEEFERNPTNCWTLWYLLGHYFKEHDLNNFIECALVFVTHQHHDERWAQIRSSLEFILKNVSETTPIQRDQITQVLAANKA